MIHFFHHKKKREIELNTYYCDLCTLMGTKLLDFQSFRDFFDMDAQVVDRYRAKSSSRTIPKSVAFVPISHRNQNSPPPQRISAGSHRPVSSLFEHAPSSKAYFLFILIYGGSIGS